MTQIPYFDWRAHGAAVVKDGSVNGQYIESTLSASMFNFRAWFTQQLDLLITKVRDPSGQDYEWACLSILQPRGTTAGFLFYDKANFNTRWGVQFVLKGRVHTHTSCGFNLVATRNFQTKRHWEDKDAATLPEVCRQIDQSCWELGIRILHVGEAVKRRALLEGWEETNAFLDEWNSTDQRVILREFNADHFIHLGDRIKVNDLQAHRRR